MNGLEFFVACVACAAAVWLSYVLGRYRGLVEFAESRDNKMDSFAARENCLRGDVSREKKRADELDAEIESLQEAIANERANRVTRAKIELFAAEDAAGEPKGE